MAFARVQTVRSAPVLIVVAGWRQVSWEEEGRTGITKRCSVFVFFFSERCSVFVDTEKVLCFVASLTVLMFCLVASFGQW
jgi:hypothetical protein